MNIKRCILAGLAVFIILQILDFIVHGVILNSTYQILQNVWRPDMMEKMWILHATSFVFSFIFVYIFAKGFENKGIAEGIRYGLIIGLFMYTVGMFNQYAIYPIPLVLATQWFIYGLIEMVLCGIVAALVYRPKLNP